MEVSPLQSARYAYVPKVPQALSADPASIAVALGEPTEAAADPMELQGLFPHTYGMPVARFVAGSSPSVGAPLTVGVILSGGQAPGGHNVITGLYDGLKRMNPASRLLGFRGGPSGLLEDKYTEIDDALVARYRNTGGFDMIGSGRTKLEKTDQFEVVLQVAARRGLDAIVVVGGDDSNTNAAVLAEYFKAKGSHLRVIGVPKTIDGDLKNDWIEASFGFDTATKTYAEQVGNICRDANSAKKYWHFIRLMGRSASHIALECALQTRPNLCIVSEEVEARGLTLKALVEEVADLVMARYAAGYKYGVVLVPEGLIEFIPEFKALISELNEILVREKEAYDELKSFEDQTEFIAEELSDHSAKLFGSLPRVIRAQLLRERDPHGNVQVSLVETERLLVEQVRELLQKRKRRKLWSGSFASQSHFFGYEGRCAFPTNFDADYCYTLGHTASLLVAHGLSGYIASVRKLHLEAQKWEAGGIPLVSMMNMEQRGGKRKPVIRKALVDLGGAPFRTFQEQREAWALSVDYRCPGAIQYYGPPAVCDQPTLTLGLEAGSR